FAAAKKVLDEALNADSLDPTGETRYLLGLACFHLEDWDAAEIHMRAVLRNPQSPYAQLAKNLLARVQINRKTRIDCRADPLPPFDAAALRSPPALAIRAPELSDPRLPAAERRGLFSRLVTCALGLLVGTS